MWVKLRTGGLSVIVEIAIPRIFGSKAVEIPEHLNKERCWIKTNNHEPIPKCYDAVWCLQWWHPCLANTIARNVLRILLIILIVEPLIILIFRGVDRFVIIVFFIYWVIWFECILGVIIVVVEVGDIWS